MNGKFIVVLSSLIVIDIVVRANGDSIPYPDPGTANVTTYTFTATANGPVTAYFAGSTAGWTESLGMEVNGVVTSSGVFSNHITSVGTSATLAESVTAGDILTFFIDIATSPHQARVYSNPSLNTGNYVGQNHVYSAPYTATENIISTGAPARADNNYTLPLSARIPAGTFVSFEDEPYASSDLNYNDEDFVFTNVSSAQTINAAPEPMVASSVLALLAGLAFCPCRRHAPQS